MMNTSTPPPRQVPTSGASHRRTKYMFRLISSFVVGVLAVVVGVTSVGVPEAAALPTMVKPTAVPSGYLLESTWKASHNTTIGVGERASDMTAAKLVEEKQYKKLVNGVWNYYCVETTMVHYEQVKDELGGLTNAQLDNRLDIALTAVNSKIRADANARSMSGLTSHYDAQYNYLTIKAEWPQRCDQGNDIRAADGRLLWGTTFSRGLVAGVAGAIASAATMAGIMWVASVFGISFAAYIGVTATAIALACVGGWAGEFAFMWVNSGKLPTWGEFFIGGITGCFVQAIMAAPAAFAAGAAHTAAKTAAERAAVELARVLDGSSSGQGQMISLLSADASVPSSINAIVSENAFDETANVVRRFSAGF